MRYAARSNFLSVQSVCSTNAKDYEFSRATVRELWKAGLDDVRRAYERREWLAAREVVEGVREIDLSRC